MLLDDLKVLDLTHYVAGPYCTKLFADLGAEVWKIEPPGRGDPCRGIGPFPGDRSHPERSGLFLYLNTGKKSVTLDLRSEQGKELFLELAREADVLVESFKPGVIGRMGLDYETLKGLNPSLVMTSISSFGQSGPYRDYEVTEIGLHALSGLMHVAGEPGREPLKKGGNFAQYHGSLNGFVATMSALFYRNMTGEGQHVDVSIAESFVAINGRPLKIYAYTGEIASREGVQARAWPSGFYLCQDGYVAFSPTQGRDWWTDFVEMVDIPEMRDERFTTKEGRAENAEELDAYFTVWLVEHTKEEVYRLSQEHRIPSGYLCDAQDLLDSPQFQARGFYAEVDHPEAGGQMLPGLPFKVSSHQGKGNRAPLLGEHNEEVLCGVLGLSKADLGALKDVGTV
jgi:crotonobetainyl-CoA:carnitine CoA-transferase CaiB-like acyl-CoA transferase